jgi:flagellar protein FliO/FliZ
VSSLFGIEASRAVQFAIAFAIILVLLVLFGVVFRKLTGARLMMPGSGDRSRSRQPRLGIVDVYDLDRQRQLLLLRRDNVEHLLLIGGPNDVVIETNIVRVAGARIPAPSNDTGAERFEPTLDQPPRAPQVESNGRPSIESQLAAQLGSFVRRPSEESDIDEELSPVAKVSAPIPAHPEPVLKPDAVAVSSAPTIQGLRAEARGPGDQSPSPPPIPVVERSEPRPTFTPPPFQSRATPVPPASPMPPMPPEPVRPPQPAAEERPAPSERPAPGAGLLSDMARQLEEALKRPSIPVPPPPAPVAPVASPVVQEETKDEDELPELAGLSSADVEEIAAEETLEEEDRAEETELAVTAEPAPPPEPVRPAPPPPPVSAPLPPQAKEASAAQQKPTDPFSVEDIEAEFARLLGRPLDPGKKG